jgi:uncharacterized protein (TIGR03000 family)
LAGYGGYGSFGTTIVYTVPTYEYSSLWTTFPTTPLPYAGSYPRMRPAVYPETNPYAWTEGVVPGGHHGDVLPPAACAAAVCGSLTYAPVAYSPAGYAAVTVAALTPAARVRQAYYPPEAVTGAAQADGPRAEVDVRLPTPDAEVWFDGVPTKLTGTRRQFFTPPLRTGGKFTYAVRARWQENGQTREEVRDIFLRAGAVLEVSFPAGRLKENPGTAARPVGEDRSGVSARRDP